MNLHQLAQVQADLMNRNKSIVNIDKLHYPTAIHQLRAIAPSERQAYALWRNDPDALAILQKTYPNNALASSGLYWCMLFDTGLKHELSFSLQVKTNIFIYKSYAADSLSRNDPEELYCLTDIIDMHNNLRPNSPPYIHNPQLTELAYLAINRPTLEFVQNIPFRFYGQNLARGYNSIIDIMKAWGTYNLNNPYYTDIGLAVKKDYWCILYGTPNLTPSTLRSNLTNQIASIESLL